MIDKCIFLSKFAPMKRFLFILMILVASVGSNAQINTDQVLRVGQNALYFEDYMVSIQYFNRVIQAKPYLAQPYFFRAIAKLNLEDYTGAEQDAAKAIELNPYLTDAWEVRGVARQNLGRNEGAIEDYKHALKLLPRNRQLMFNMALAQQDVNNLHEADSTFNELLKFYPGFDSGYLGRARLRLEQSDTVNAIADIDKALSINKNAINAYIMRADIAINRGDSLERAVSDMDEAIRLQPHMAGLYVNRAYLRYRLDDFFGAMADYDYAIELDPINETAIFNRSLLEMETAANDKALVDLDRIITLNPDNTRAYYNRAIVNSLKGRNKEAIEDITRVSEAVPELPDPYFMRSQFYYALGNMASAERDYNKGIALSKKAQSLKDDFNPGMITPTNDAASRNDNNNTNKNPQLGQTPEASEEAARRFATLLTVNDNAEIHEEYNNSAIRGKIQDRKLNIEPEPWIELAYYASSSELRPNTYYIKEVDDLNATRVLRFTIRVTPEIPTLDESSTAKHLQSIEYYNSYIASHAPRAIDYIGRAMDFMTVHDYSSALRDIDRAIALTPDIAVAYLMRAQAGYHNWQLEKKKPATRDGAAKDKLDSMTAATLSRKATDDILADLDKALELSPSMAEAWYNKAVTYISTEDYTSALAALNRTIELKPEMGEAFYNRGYVYLRLGNERLGIADLSRAGQLGILPAYNLIKRISR